ncbi:MAG: U32 family peptidase [Candidatus Gastranaerophilales bacterium]|nr:U32 family peptidase [Candidatus Gastranaerophilales bacterium]
MNRAELLLPAGNIEKMKYAIAYGADAVYLGTADFSLRSPKAGNIITDENLKSSIDIAHKMGAKAYVTLNVFANNEIIEKIDPIIEILQDAKPDAVIFADAGFYRPLKTKLPDIPLHVSTQANVLNHEAVKFWRDLGISRVILARELSLKEIEQISAKVPDVELEVLVHGSVCVAYSGRCLLSDYMTNNERKSNQGNCAQPCRWPYQIKLTDSRRPDEEYVLTEDDNCSYIMNPKDIALIEHLPALIEAGVCSFKVEGRTKSMYYASVVAKAYRAALDAYYEGKTPNYDELFEELKCAGNRGMTTGFLVEKPDSEHYNYGTSKSKAKSVFQGIITERVAPDKYKVTVKNQMQSGDSYDIIFPEGAINTVIADMFDEYGEKLEVANTNAEITVILRDMPENLASGEWGIIRRKETANNEANANLYCGTCN